MIIIEVLIGHNSIILVLFTVLGALLIAQLTVIQILTLGAVQLLTLRTLTLAKTPLIHTLLIGRTEYALAIVHTGAAVLHIHALHLDGDLFEGPLLLLCVGQRLLVESHVHHAAVVVIATYLITGHLDREKA